MPADPIVRAQFPPTVAVPRPASGEACANGKATRNPFDDAPSIDNNGYEQIPLNLLDIGCHVHLDLATNSLVIEDAGDYIVIGHIIFESNTDSVGGARMAQVSRWVESGSENIVTSTVAGFGGVSSFPSQTVTAVGFAAFAVGDRIQLYGGQTNTGGVPLQVISDPSFGFYADATHLTVIKKCACGVPHNVAISG